MTLVDNEKDQTKEVDEVAEDGENNDNPCIICCQNTNEITPDEPSLKLEWNMKSMVCSFYIISYITIIFFLLLFKRLLQSFLNIFCY